MALKDNYRIEDGAIALKTIDRGDIELLRTWRNQDGARKRFLSTGHITAEQQDAWFERYLADGTDYTFLVSLDGKPCGMGAVYHIDGVSKTCEFGRLLIGEAFARGQGLGFAITRALCEFAFERLGMEIVTLEVFSDNFPAYKTYLKVGFSTDGTREENGREVIVMLLRRKDLP